jgi:hypothetical protein
LLVCKRDIVDRKPSIVGWTENVEPFLVAKDRKFSWEFEGRLLSLTYWGGYGIGANHWKEADVVLLFADHHLPQHANVAAAQGVKRASATEPPLARMTSPGSGSEEVRQIRDGHLLRWTKQMALRGRSREFDENGVCGPQKLVVTGDYKLLMANLDRVFPGATLRSEGSGKASKLDMLLRFLSTPGLASRVSTKEVGEHFGCKWRDISSDLTGHPLFEILLRNASWRYVSRQGKAGAYFERIESITQPKERHDDPEAERGRGASSVPKAHH